MGALPSQPWARAGHLQTGCWQQQDEAGCLLQRLGGRKLPNRAFYSPADLAPQRLHSARGHWPGGGGWFWDQPASRAPQSALPSRLGAPAALGAGSTHPVHVFVLEEEHVGVHAVLPELLHVLEPGAVAHCGDKETGEPSREAAGTREWPCPAPLSRRLLSGGLGL